MCSHSDSGVDTVAAETLVPTHQTTGEVKTRATGTAALWEGGVGEIRGGLRTGKGEGGKAIEKWEQRWWWWGKKMRDKKGNCSESSWEIANNMVVERGRGRLKLHTEAERYLRKCEKKQSCLSEISVSWMRNSKRKREWRKRRGTGGRTTRQ